MKKRLALFLLFSLIAPCAYIAIRFNAFTPKNSTTIGFWGVVVLCIMVSVISVLIKYYLDGLKTKYSFLKQVLHGTIKIVLPLLLTIAILYLLKNNIDMLIESLLVITPCEIVAILINPLPKWCFENNVEGLGEIFEKIKGGNK